LGETEIPRNPQRIVVAQHAWLEAFMELDAPVVGAARDTTPASGLEIGFSLSKEGEERYDTSGIESIGTAEAPNVEKIATLNPDLIFVAGVGEGGEEYYRELYDQLKEVAPTVAPPVYGAQSNREAIGMVAELLGEEDRLEELNAAYEENVADLSRRVEEIGREDLTVSVVQFYGTGSFGISDEASSYGYVEVMADAEIPRPAPQVGINGTEEVSIEKIGDHDADVMGVVCYGDIEGEACTDLFELPVYGATNAGRLGQDYVFAADEWPTQSYASLNTIVDQFEEMLSEDLDVSVDFRSAIPRIR